MYRWYESLSQPTISTHPTLSAHHNLSTLFPSLPSPPTNAQLYRWYESRFLNSSQVEEMKIPATLEIMYQESERPLLLFHPISTPTLFHPLSTPTPLLLYVISTLILQYPYSPPSLLPFPTYRFSTPILLYPLSLPFLLSLYPYSFPTLEDYYPL